jgi:hypothetical protein
MGTTTATAMTTTGREASSPWELVNEVVEP